MLKCVNVEELIRDTMLDMMESRPFYRIKVSDLAGAANIGRSTFYLHYDSIYDVIEQIEEDFLQGLSDKMTVRKAGLVQDDAADLDAGRAAEKANAGYIRRNSRAFRLLTGPNGDPSFMIKLTRRTRGYLIDQVKKQGSQALQDKYVDLLSEYMVNGNIAFLRYCASHADEYTDEEISEFHRRLLDQMSPILSSRIEIQ